ncbi:MAG: TraB/GumN family protein [Gammaproteobacteria bacterium]|nr:TraB/GumN family protein [Gammaproteobacteria bacterium]
MRKSLLAILLVWVPCLTLADAHPVTMWLAEGTNNRIYILGSVHLLRQQDHPLPSVMEAAYDDAEALIMEVDMDDLDPAALQVATNQLGVIHDDRTLRDFMGDGLYQQAVVAAEEMDIPFDMLSKTEPWYAAITVEQLALMRIGFNPMYGIEMHMTMKATQDGKSIEGLETVEEQLAYLDGLSLDAQNDLLMQTLAEGKNIEAFMDDMVRAWRNGDIDYMKDTMLEDMAQYPELYKSIVVDRNRRWVGTIEDLLDDNDDYLIIVGALHLIGEHGLPALLAKRGIRIGQLNESL